MLTAYAQGKTEKNCVNMNITYIYEPEHNYLFKKIAKHIRNIMKRFFI